MDFARLRIETVVAIALASCMTAAVAPSAARTSQTAKAGITAERKLTTELMARVDDVISRAAFSLSDRDRVLLEVAISQAATTMMQNARAAGTEPSPEQLETLRQAILRFATDLVNYGNAVAATVATSTSESQSRVDIQSENSVKFDFESTGRSADRKLLGRGFGLGAVRPASAVPPNLVCLDAKRLADLRNRVNSLSAADTRTAIPVRALFESILQTSIPLSLPAPSRLDAQPGEGRCVSGTTLEALEYMLHSALRSDRSPRSMLGAPIGSQTRYAPDNPGKRSEELPSPSATPGPRKPLLSGLYDLFAPFCPLYPAC